MLAMLLLSAGGVQSVLVGLHFLHHFFGSDRLEDIKGLVKELPSSLPITGSVA